MGIDVDEHHRAIRQFFEYRPEVTRDVDASIPRPLALQGMIIEQLVRGVLLKQKQAFVEMLANGRGSLPVRFLEALME